MEEPQIFISYCWSTPKNKCWVIEFANRLTSDGILVRLDTWDLKPGQDTFWFMEKMLKNKGIKKVLLICDEPYQKKANNRKGGVGTEAELISKEVYGNPEQEKFIPIIKERDEEGKPYLPNFLETRFYIDLSNDSFDEEEYKKLIGYIYEKPIEQRPSLGPVPAYISKNNLDKAKDVIKNQTFNDVPPKASYFDYVEQLVIDGVIDPSNNYYPNNTISRAEFIKIVINVIDGLAGYEAPEFPTFTDVNIDAWHFNYIESAAQLGIITGYKDIKGNLTGLFGPDDIANRDWATEVLVNSFVIEKVLSPSLPFTDVNPSNKYYEDILTAYNQSIINGFENHKFFPNEPLTRDVMAEWISNAKNPTLRQQT